MKPDPVLRDGLILVIGAVTAALLGLFGFREMISEKWRVVGFAAGPFVAFVLIKLAMPGHSIMRLFSWPYMLVTMVLWLSAVVLMSDQSLLDVWTLPAIVALVAAAFLVRAIFGPRMDEGRADRRQDSAQE